MIVAGYENRMADFLAANPGLASRFPTTVRFSDYTEEELVAIFESMRRPPGSSCATASATRCAARYGRPRVEIPSATAGSSATSSTGRWRSRPNAC